MITTNVLFYKKYKQLINIEDYVEWACNMLLKDIDTESIRVVASFNKTDSIFEVEEYFYKALKELGIKEPAPESCARSYIRHVSEMILEGKYDIFGLAYVIYRVVSSLGYPEDLMEWFDISEMIEDITSSTFSTNLFTKEDVKKRIIEQAAIQINVDINSESI